MYLFMQKVTEMAAEAPAAVSKKYYQRQRHHHHSRPYQQLLLHAHQLLSPVIIDGNCMLSWALSE